MNDPQSVRPVPANTIVAYVIPGVTRDITRVIRPCRPARDWMDRTPGQYAYRCIPLSAANTMGWELMNPVDVEMPGAFREDARIEWNLRVSYAHTPDPERCA